jgi:hypothetical protein
MLQTILKIFTRSSIISAGQFLIDTGRIVTVGRRARLIWGKKPARNLSLEHDSQPSPSEYLELKIA